MHETYCRIFTRCGLDFRPVQADTGSIGGNASHEFHVLAASGEDAIAFSTASDYAANVELAEAVALTDTAPAPTRTRDWSTRRTPAPSPIWSSNSASRSNARSRRSWSLQPEEHRVRAGRAAGARRSRTQRHQGRETAAGRRAAAHGDRGRDPRAIGAGPGSLGPKDLPIPCIVDRTVAVTADFSAGANQDGKHWFGLNWGRDLPLPEVADLRNVVEGDPSPTVRARSPSRAASRSVTSSSSVANTARR
jgi:prolyl-tRNA synthetase